MLSLQETARTIAKTSSEFIDSEFSSLQELLFSIARCVEVDENGDAFLRVSQISNTQILPYSDEPVADDGGNAETDLSDEVLQ